MKKLWLSFTLIIAFAFYALLNASKPPSGDGLLASDTSVGNAPPAASDTASNTTPSPTAGSDTSSPPTPNPTPVPAPTPAPQPQGQYKDGTYTGSVADAYYGYVQAEAVVSGGTLADVKILRYPNDRGTSVAINTQAMPILRQEALQTQSSSVDIVSGATDSSLAFRQSLHAALAQALP